jgi:transposase
VGIDLHRRRSVIVGRSAEGGTTWVERVDNCPVELASAAGRAAPVNSGEPPEVVMEATYGWYWAADVLTEAGYRLHLAHPLGNNWGHRRVKNDVRDATDLADLLRLGRLAEAWIAPAEIRELRELVRYRQKLVRLCSGLKAQAHAVVAKCGVKVPMSDLFGVAGNQLLDELELPDAYAMRLASLRWLIETIDTEIDEFDDAIDEAIDGDLRAGYVAIQAIPGVGPVLAAVFVAEIGDIHRFPGPAQLCSWAGLTPRHRESDAKVQRGQITKQGSRLLRWAAVEAVSRARGGPISSFKREVGERRGKNIGRVAAARKLLTLVFYGLRDGHIRCLDPAEAG